MRDRVCLPGPPSEGGFEEMVQHILSSRRRLTWETFVKACLLYEDAPETHARRTLFLLLIGKLHKNRALEAQARREPPTANCRNMMAWGGQGVCAIS
jgi:hypothetical protein